MAQTPSTWDDYVGDGVEDTFQVTFPYQKQQEVFVTVDGDPAAFTFISVGWVQLAAAPANGAAIRVQRSTEAFEPRHEFANGVPLLPRSIDENNKQFLYVVQEAVNETAGVAADALGTAEEAVVIAQAASDKVDAAVLDSALQLRQDLTAPTPGLGAALVGYGGRTVAQNLDDVLNVLNFGASTSNTAEQNRVAFQAALDEQASTGKAIYVPGSTGEYLTGALRASAPVVMFGAGQGKTVIRFDDTTHGVTWLDFNLPTPVNGSYTLIEGFTLYGPGRLVDNDSIAFKFAPGVGTNRGIKFTDVWIEAFNLFGIQVPDSIHFKAIDCRFRRIGVRAPANEGGKGAGIRWQAGGGFVNPKTSCIQNEVIRCTFTAQFIGIQCKSDEPTFFCTIQDSDFQDCRYGITANSSRVWRIMGCYFETNDVAGAELRDGIEIGSRQTYGEQNDIVFSGRYVRLNDIGLRIGRAGVDILDADLNRQRVTARLLSGTLVYGPDQPGTVAAPGIYSGLGSPVGVVNAMIGSIYSDRGAASGAGALWVKFGDSSNTNIRWAPAALVRSGATASRPSTPQVGTSYFDISLGKPIWWSGGAWVDAAGVSV